MLSLNYRHYVLYFVLSTAQTFHPNIEFYLNALPCLMHGSLYRRAFKIIDVGVLPDHQTYPFSVPVGNATLRQIAKCRCICNRCYQLQRYATPGPPQISLQKQSVRKGQEEFLDFKEQKKRSENKLRKRDAIFFSPCPSRRLSRSPTLSRSSDR